MECHSWSLGCVVIAGASFLIPHSTVNTLGQSEQYRPSVKKEPAMFAASVVEHQIEGGGSTSWGGGCAHVPK